jgi:hypothetical protein
MAQWKIFFFPFYTIEAFDEVEVHIYSFLYSTLEGSELHIPATLSPKMLVPAPIEWVAGWGCMEPPECCGGKKLPYPFLDTGGKVLSVFPRYWQSL